MDFDPRRGEGPPIECKGELVYQPRVVALEDAIEMGKERRPFLKQQNANVQNARQQVGVAFGGFFPTVNADAAYEWDSSPFTSDISKVSKGWFWGATGTWNIFDGLATVGRIKQHARLLSQSQITYDDAVRQVELEVQTAFANLVRKTARPSRASKKPSSKRRKLFVWPARALAPAPARSSMCSTRRSR